MANYRNISVTFWTDSKVDDEFTPEDKYFYLYLLTNPHTNICGCYEISMKQMERETGYNSDTVKRLLKRMQKTHEVIQYCEETKEILIINWCKYNWTGSDNVKKAVLKVSEYIKSGRFRKYVTDTVSIGYPYRMETSVSDTDTDTDSVTDSDTDSETDTEYRYRDRKDAENQQKRKRFTPPTVEEVYAYCQERKNEVDAHRFVDYYTANGWKVGKNQMKDWKAAVRNWERQERQYKPEKKKSMASFSADDLDALVNNF